MPPVPLEYHGRPAIGEFLARVRCWRKANACGWSPTRANCQPAFAYYMPDSQADVWRIGGIFVLTVEGEEIVEITRFGEGGWLAWFGLPRVLRG